MRAFKRIGRAHVGVWMIRALTALLVGLALTASITGYAPYAWARPGGGQTFRASPSPVSRPSPSPSPRSSPSPAYRPSSPSYNSGSSSRSTYGSGTSSSDSSSSGVYVPSSSYSSGGGGGGSRGGGLGLCMVVFVLLVLAVIVFGIYSRAQKERPDWSSMAEVPLPPPQNTHRATSINEGFAALLKIDPGFSRTLLEDFLYALYGEVQRRRGGGRLPELAAYLSPGAQRAYMTNQADEVRDIVVGALTFERVHIPSGSTGRARLHVRFISNFTEIAGGRAQAYYVEEVWTISRNVETPSRKPENARVIGCPSCGGPLDSNTQGVCRYCNARISGEEELDWFVDDIAVEQREARPPMLTGTVEEQGTDLPTIHDPALQQNQAALAARDPELSWPAFEARVATIFRAFHESWTAQDLGPVRPFLSDNLFDTQAYWVAAYKAQGLRNISERPELKSTELCKIDSDGHYDTVTVRMWAQNLDYTLDASNRVVGGDRGKVRQYTEYWTLIRGRGAHGTPKAERVCPSCGAPAEQINMAGTCQHCGNKVTNGQFDWVLSRIEQDEVYLG